MKNELLLEVKGYQYIEEDDSVMGYFCYADYVDKVFDLVIGDKIIQNYMEIYKQIKDKDIDDLSIEEIVAYFTYIQRGERFCDGHISKYLDNGIFAKLFERYLECTK